MSALYERFRDGDRRTRVQRFEKGERVLIGDTMFVFRTDVKVPVYEQYVISLDRWTKVEFEEALKRAVDVSRPLPWWWRLLRWFWRS